MTVRAIGFRLTVPPLGSRKEIMSSVLNVAVCLQVPIFLESQSEPSWSSRSPSGGMDGEGRHARCD